MHCLCRCLQLFPFLCSEAASGASLLCPSQLITALSLRHLCLAVEPHCRADRVHLDSQHIQGVNCGGVASGALLEQAPTTATTSPRLCPGIRTTRLLLHPMDRLSPQSWQLQVPCHAATWSEWGWSVLLAWELGNHYSCPLTVLSTLCQGQASVHSLFMSRGQASCSPPAIPSWLPARQGGSSPLCRAPGMGCPVWGSRRSLHRGDLHLCNLPFALSPLPGA